MRGKLRPIYCAAPCERHDNSQFPVSPNGLLTAKTRLRPIGPRETLSKRRNPACLGSVLIQATCALGPGGWQAQARPTRCGRSTREGSNAGMRPARPQPFGLSSNAALALSRVSRRGATIPFAALRAIIRNGRQRTRRLNENRPAREGSTRAKPRRLVRPWRPMPPRRDARIRRLDARAARRGCQGRWPAWPRFRVREPRAPRWGRRMRSRHSRPNAHRRIRSCKPRGRR